MLDVADAAVRDAALDDNGAVAEREPKIVQGIVVEGETGFDLSAAAADVFDRHRLEDHDLAEEIAQDLDALGVSLL